MWIKTAKMVFLAYLAITCLIARCEAQTCFDVNLAGSEFHQPGQAQACSSEDYTKTHATDDERECLMEADSVPPKMWHRWVFPAVSPGELYLTFEGYRPAGSNDDFQFAYNTTGSELVYTDIPNAEIDNASEDTCRSGFTVPLATTTQSHTIYLLLKAVGVGDGDTQLDSVFIDYLRICTRPTYEFSESSTCHDSFDNDLDFLIDCQDQSCLDVPGGCESLCFDGIDNDGDGDTDCGADSDCEGRPGCGA